MKSASARAAAVVIAAVIAACDFSTPRTHRLPATPKTVVIGYFAADAKPVLRVSSGDIIEVDTLITSTPRELVRLGLPTAEVQRSLDEITSNASARDSVGHILNGPVFVEGAHPNQALEVRVLTVDLAVPYGYAACSAAWTFVPENCEEPKARLVRIDLAKKMILFAPGVEIPARPFFGVMGAAPSADAGKISSLPPGNHGGNFDNKELVAGTKLFLPVRVEGGLFEVGDGHAAQGDGETGGTALETSLHGRLQLIARPDLHLTWPRAETPTHYITMGADPELTKAGRIAVQQMVDFLMSTRHLARTEANRLLGIAADLRISELSDGNVGAYVMVPKAIFLH
jgi:acetamidase/formamidase